VLELTPDELLSTTRAVRKRLDLERPVERGVLEECLQLAQQAPTGSYRQNWHFLVVTERGPDHWGRYRDRYVCRAGAWRFAHRRVRLEGYAPGSWAAL